MIKNVVIPPSAAGERLSDWLAKERHSLPADCGGRGTCGKCRVRVLRGVFLRYSALGGEEAYLPDTNGEILACRALIPRGGGEVAFVLDYGSGLTEYSATGGVSSKKGLAGTDTRLRSLGVALDIGTTTLAYSLVDRRGGKIIDTYSCLNPQRSYGADVISRIHASGKGHLPELCRLIRDKTAEVLELFIRKNSGKRPGLLVVSGNTTMLHLFAGISPEGIGVFPFTPAFTEIKEYSGEEIDLPVDRVVLLPSAAAYIGSDVAGGLFVCRLTEHERPSALIDIGTNGEMAVFTGSSRGARLIAASAAAGPALEGANISSGVGGIPGAVCHVAPADAGGRLTFSTIDDKPPVGICGCGLIDLVATLLEAGVIDETGYMEAGEYRLCGHVEANALHVSRQSGEPLSDATSSAPVFLTQKDVREFQLAKSAIYAGFSSLLSYAGIDVSELESIYIAGGLGYYMDVGSAARAGILPPAQTEKFRVVGNTSLAGAVACLTDAEALKKIEEIAGRCEVLDLNSLPLFSDLFMGNMMFPES